MQNMCEECQKRPARKNHFLCWSCAQAESRRDIEALQLRSLRVEKIELREFEMDIPVLNRRMRILRSGQQI
jgi:hypothetical protein